MPNIDRINEVFLEGAWSQRVKHVAQLTAMIDFWADLYTIAGSVHKFSSPSKYSQFQELTYIGFRSILCGSVEILLPDASGQYMLWYTDYQGYCEETPQWECTRC